MDDLYDVMQEVLWRENKIDELGLSIDTTEKEHFWVLGLDDQSRILFIESGKWSTTYNQQLEPVGIFSLALQKQAKQLVLCRSIAHSQQILTPQKEEKDVVDRLIQIGHIVNMPIIDHQIISPKEYLSFEQLGLMEELQQSRKYVPSFELAQKIQEEAAALLQNKDAEAKAKIERIRKELKIAQEKTRQSKFQIAKELKEEGIDWAIIVKVTGLSLEEVENL